MTFSSPTVLAFVSALLLFPAALAGAQPDDWAEGGSDSEDGATRDFYNRGALLPWQQLGGDWRDLTGELHGDTAYAETRVADTDEGRFIEWDVTRLVQAWLAGDVRPLGFLLRGLEGGGPINFSSKEGSNAPELVVDGVTRLAEADTHLPRSTFRDRGERDSLQVARDSHVLVRFDLDGLDGAASARLRLYTTTQFGGGMTIGVFPVVTADPAPAVEQGLAAGFERDEGVGSHVDVWMADDFEAEDWMNHWSDHSGDYEVTASPDFGYEPLGEGRALRARIPEGEQTALGTSYRFMEETGSEPDEIYFRYYIRLGSDWDQTVSGGKLPGVAGTYNTAGWGGRRSNGSNGWSARGSFHGTIPPGNNPLAGHTAVGSYVYHADMDTDFGDGFPWVEGWSSEGEGGVLARGRWYCMEQYVRLNTPGDNDGEIRAWVNGRPAMHTVGLRFRDVARLRIERIWMNIFHGGTSRSPADQHVFIDHVVIARSYIGPMGGVVSSPDAGMRDGGVDGGRSDAGMTDASTGGVLDGASTGDTSTGGPEDDASGGCGCTASRSGGGGGLWPVFFVLVFLLRRSRPTCGRTRTEKLEGSWRPELRAPAPRLR